MTYVVVFGVDLVEGCVHHGLDRVECVQHLLTHLQILLGTLQILQSLFGVGHVG